MKGILLVDKPMDWTSSDVVAVIRRATGIRRCGHTGTLDPMVTGVLPICVGNATRISEFIMEQGKRYRAYLAFGKKTDSYDAYGTVLETCEIKSFQRDVIEEVLKKYTGEIKQKPPIYSAKWIDGKRLYQYALEGKEVDIPEYDVTVYSLDLIEMKDDGFIFDIHCSKGTYVRSLINDIGESLGTLAYMKDLVRTGVGAFTLDECISPDLIKTMPRDEIGSRLISIDQALSNLSRINILEEVTERLENGQKLNTAKIANEKSIVSGKFSDTYKVFCNGSFIGIGKIEKNILRMERVLSRD